MKKAHTPIGKSKKQRDETKNKCMLYFMEFLCTSEAILGFGDIYFSSF